MKTWHRLDLGNGEDALKPSNQIQEAFMAIFMAAPTADMALFSSYDLEADNVQLFFTPDTSKLAFAFGAVPCDKPVPGRFRIGLLAGNQDALSRHFPNQRRA